MTTEVKLTEKEQKLLDTLITDCIEDEGDGGFIGWYMLEMELDMNNETFGLLASLQDKGVLTVQNRPDEEVKCVIIEDEWLPQ